MAHRVPTNGCNFFAITLVRLAVRIRLLYSSPFVSFSLSLSFSRRIQRREHARLSLLESTKRQALFGLQGPDAGCNDTYFTILAKTSLSLSLRNQESREFFFFFFRRRFYKDFSFVFKARKVAAESDTAESRDPYLNPARGF